MNNEMRVALHILMLANKFTGWNFEVEQGDGSYLIQTSRQTKERKVINVSYLVEDGSVLLTVLAPDCRFNHKYVRNRVSVLPQEHPINVTEVGNHSIFFTCLMDLDDFENEMGDIVVDLMADMVNAMTDIISHGAKKR